MLFPVQVAIKLLPRGDFVKQYQTYVRREIQNQSSLRHPLIVSLREVHLAFCGLCKPNEAQCIAGAITYWPWE